MTSEPVPKKKSKVSAGSGPQLVIHLDLNKTILAVDEVKQYGRTEVVYLEQWKGDEDFLKWAYIKHGPDSGEAFFGGKYAWRRKGKEEPEKKPEEPIPHEQLSLEDWIADLTLPKNEPTLIKYAQEYCSLDKTRAVTMEEILSNIDEGNCVKSFFTLLDWARHHSKRRVLVCFGTYGSDLPAIFDHLDTKDYGAYVVRDAGGAGRPQIWTVMHKQDADKGFGGDWVKDKLDSVGGYIQPGNPVPGPKQKHAPEFQTRTVKFEEAAAALFKTGGALQPVVCTAAPDVGADRNLQPFAAAPAPEHIHPITAMTDLLSRVSFGSDGSGNGSALRIMGIQDNYKPWSRKNPLNGKVAVLDASESAPFDQLFFDDYSFTKKSAQGAYIWALHSRDGRAITGTKEELQAQYSAEEPHRAQAAQPCIFSVVLNKKGQKETAVHDTNYFVRRVQAAL